MNDDAMESKVVYETIVEALQFCESFAIILLTKNYENVFLMYYTVV